MTWREEASTERRGARQRASRWLRPVLVAALILRCTTVFGAPAGADEDRKLDGSLRHRVRQGSSSERVSVIVTPRRGARARILERLKAEGGTVNGNYGLTEALVVSVPKHVARRMAREAEVEAISSDEPVYADAMAASALGTAANSPYTLRSTLGLDVVSGVAATKSFAQGAYGYQSGVNASVNSSNPGGTLSYAATATLVEGGVYGGRSGLMVRFDNLFGDGVNQIPYGSVITSATLTVSGRGDGSSSATAGLYRMLVDWSATSSWAP